MRHALLTAAAVLAVLGGLMAVPAAQQPPQARRSSFASDLRARHPEIVTDAEFRSWLDGTSVGPWYETRLDPQSRRKVVILDEAGRKVFAAQLALLGPRPTIERRARIDLAALGQTLADIQSLSGGWAPQAVGARRPVVDFQSDDRFEFAWEVDVVEPSRVRTFRLGKDKSFTPVGERSIKSPLLAAGPGSGTDDLAENDLHHPSAFAQEAAAWTAGSATIRDKAVQIFERMTLDAKHPTDVYTYDGTITGIDTFTWSDVLTRHQNNRAGVCDELAVVAVTYLRSLGITARLKMLWWTETGYPDRVFHMAAEFADGSGTWRLIDPAKKFISPDAYRKELQATNVTVSDATFPLDSRSSGNVGSVADPNGDGKLNPLGDFIIKPAPEGIARPGYSY